MPISESVHRFLGHVVSQARSGGCPLGPGTGGMGFLEEGARSHRPIHNWTLMKHPPEGAVAFQPCVDDRIIPPSQGEPDRILR
jgi:hypothetical protein